jgi:hypothetical protein
MNGSSIARSHAAEGFEGGYTLAFGGKFVWRRVLAIHQMYKEPTTGQLIGYAYARRQKKKKKEQQPRILDKVPLSITAYSLIWTST